MDVLAYLASQNWSHSTIQTEIQIHFFETQLRKGNDMLTINEAVDVARQVEKWLSDRYGSMTKERSDEIKRGYFAVVSLLQYAVSNIPFTDKNFSIDNPSKTYSLAISMGEVNATEFKLLLDTSK